MLHPWQPIFTIGTQFKSIATDWQIIYSNVNNYSPRDLSGILSSASLALFPSPAFVLKKGDAALQWLLAPWPHSKIGCGFNLHVPPVCSRLLSRDSAASSRSPNTRTWGQLLVRVSVSADGCLSLCIGPVVNRQVVLGVTPPSPRDSWDYAPAPLRAWELEKRWWKIEKKEKKHQWVGNSC